MFNKINELIVELSKSPFDPVLSTSLAVEYERIGQTAAAVSFYLRTAEYGYNSHPDYVYAALIKTSNCFEGQKNRTMTVLNLLLKAIAYQPTRPEAWFVLTQYYERNQKWQECYTASETGLSFANAKLSPLPLDVGYWGRYTLVFQKAVSGWWVGRKDESLEILYSLLDEPNIAHNYLVAVKNNLKRIGSSEEYIDPLEPVVVNYRKYFGPIAPIIIEIGTRDGDDANYLYSKLNGDRVVAIDADESAANQTKRTYPWMAVVNSAVSDTNGTTDFHIVSDGSKENRGMSSIGNKDMSINPPAAWYEGRLKKVTVSCTRMDTLLDTTKIEGQIDVVKVDTEGFSWQVLQGFGKRLKDVKLFHLETETIPVHADHVGTEQISSFMEENGFVLVDISHEWGPTIRDQVWVNPALATRNKECFTPTTA